MLNIRMSKIGLEYLRLLTSITAFLCISGILISCSSSSSVIINKKTESEGFVLQMEIPNQFEQGEKITLNAGLYQKKSDEPIEIIYSSHLIDVKILDEKNKVIFEIGHNSINYFEKVVNDQGVLATITLINPALSNLPKKKYTIIVSSIFSYDGEEIKLILTENFKIK